MSWRQLLTGRPGLGAVMAVVLLAGPGPTPRAEAATVICPIVKDNTLFYADPDAGDLLYSNGIGNFFSAGRTRADGQIRRGLIQFDLSGIPGDAAITSAQLDLYVVDVANRGRETQRSFWLEAVQGIGAGSWIEGSSNADVYASGQGKGKPAQPGDATWVHTQYDTESWPTRGAIGDGPVVFPLAETVGSVPGGLDPIGSGPVLVSWEQSLVTHPMITDIQAWVAGTMPNHGWVVVGEEDFVDDGTDPSSKRDFATREHGDGSLAPVLTVDYTVVPEPATWAMLLGAAVAFAVRAGRSRQ